MRDFPLLVRAIQQYRDTAGIDAAWLKMSDDTRDKLRASRRYWRVMWPESFAAYMSRVPPGLDL